MKRNRLLLITALACSIGSQLLGQDRGNRPKELLKLPSGTQIGGPAPREIDVEWDRLFIPPDYLRGEENFPAASYQPVSLTALMNPLKGKPLGLIVRAKTQLYANQTDAALKTLKEALKYPVAKPYALLLMGTEHLKQTASEPSLLPVAVVELRNGLTDLPEDSAAHSNLGTALWLKGEVNEALLEAKRGVQLNPGNAGSRYVLGVILLDLGNVEEAKFHLQIAALEFDGARALLASFNPGSGSPSEAASRPTANQLAESPATSASLGTHH